MLILIGSEVVLGRERGERAKLQQIANDGMEDKLTQWRYVHSSLLMLVQFGIRLTFVITQGDL